MGWRTHQMQRLVRTLFQLFRFRGNALRIGRLMAIRMKRMVQIKEIQQRGNGKGLPTSDGWELMRRQQ